MDFGEVYLDAVTFGERMRQLDPAKVKALVGSIQEIGLQQPISIWTPNEHTCVLVSGLHRFEAAKELGWTKISCVYVDLDNIDRQILEIDENLIRSDLTELEKADHIAKRKELFDLKRATDIPPILDRREEVGGKSLPTHLDSSGRPKTPQQEKGFAADVAEKTGVSKRGVNQAIARAQKIDPKVKAEIIDLPVADTGVELDALASMTPEEQSQAVERVKSGASVNIREAKAFIKGNEDELAEERVEKELAAMKSAWNKASEAAQEAFLLWMKKDLETQLRKKKAG